MKARGKVISLVTAILCLVPLFVGALGFGDQASAAIEMVNVTLHKKKMDDFPIGGIQNDGKEMADEFDKYEPLEGVTFSAYDITDDFYTALDKELKGDEDPAAYKAVVKKVMEGFKFSDIKIKNKLDSQSTDDRGEAKFNLPDRNNKGIYRVYFFDEEDVPEKQKFSQPVILMLPFVHPEDGELHDVHLYPKNKVGGEVKKELVNDDLSVPGENDEELYDYEVGKQIKYKATFQIPHQIGENVKEGTKERTRYSQLIFKDELSAIGTKFAGIEKMVAVNKDGQKQEIVVKDFLNFADKNGTFTNHVSQTYDKSKKAGFELKMKLNDKFATSSDYTTSRATADYLAKYAGQTLEIYYGVLLTEDTPVDVDINNDFTVRLKQGSGQDEEVQTVTDKPIVTTGGKKFFKHESNKPEQGLGGAKFILIRKEDGKYLKKPAGNVRTWAAPSAGKYPDAVEFISGDDGKFEIIGVEFGEYQLVEIEAPKGFQKLDAPHDFDISKGSYEGDYDSLKEDIENATQGGFLPATGGAGIAAFLVIGLSLMGVAIVRYRKTQHAA